LLLQLLLQLLLPLHLPLPVLLFVIPQGSAIVLRLSYQSGKRAPQTNRQQRTTAPKQEEQKITEVPHD
jgi:hypothetical protein